MDLKTLDPRGRAPLALGLILLLGLGGALAVFLATGEAGGQAAGYEYSYGALYAAPPQQTKKFVHDLELFGGKANVMFYGLTSWLEERFQGRNLAYTIAFFTLAIAGAVYYFGVHLAPGAEDDDEAPPRA